MPATRSTSSTKSTRSAGGAPGKAADAIKLLTSDHREVKRLFQAYQALVDHDADASEKQPLAREICTMLTVHAQVEEEIFYPAAQVAIKEPELIAEATIEHASAKELIAQIEGGDSVDELYDARVKVLGEYIDHHVKEEEGELFPQVRRAKLDLAALGEQMQARKQELLDELGVESEAALS